MLDLMPDQPTVLAMLRGLHLAASLSLLGVLGFIAWVVPAAGADAGIMRSRLVGLCRISGIAAIVTAVGWFALEAATIAGATDLADFTAALPLVAEHTRYGNVLVVRIALLLLATVLAGDGRLRLYPALLLVAVALGLQGLLGHAGALGGRLGAGIVASESLHLVAAGVWLGALLPLWLSLGRLPERKAAAVCERFSPIGLGCVLVIAGTGLAQGIELIGNLPALLGTRYGHFASLKILLFLVALVLAAGNRLWLTDRLLQVATGARSRLRLSVVSETLVGLMIVLAAGFMASSVPAAHDQLIWPLSWQFSLVTVNEDADLRAEVIGSLLLIALAVLLLTATLLWGRWRIVGLLLLAGTLAWCGPSMELLTVEAFPTSFQTSPTGFSTASIVRGQLLFGQNCVACHGASGDGNGPLAAGLRIKPADLTMPHLWEHSDGAMFWWMTHGIDDPEGGLAMPGFATLPETDRWALIDYVRAHNAGLAMQRDAAFEVPVAAPSLPLRCTGVQASTTAELRGNVVHVVAGGGIAALAPIPPQLGVNIVTLALPRYAADGDVPPAGACVAATTVAWPAFAVLADLPPDKLAGTEFLIDANGWLRAIQIPGDTGGWHTRDDLVAAVRGICGHPIKQTSGGEHEHHH